MRSDFSHESLAFIEGICRNERETESLRRISFDVIAAETV
jgi:hypothetical protein